MADATYHFPRGFLWGTATSSHQVEGNNFRNEWWDWEQQPNHIINDDKSGAACDWWNGRWREDLDRAVDSGQNAHRLSIEWSRIQPNLEDWDEDALDRYLEILRGLKERNLTPFITLHHFTNPLWLSKAGGWENDQVVGLFEQFVRKTVRALKDYGSYWVTINEPNLYAFGSYFLGYFPPGKKNLKSAIHVLGNMIRGHAAAYHAIHEIQPSARVGIAHHYRSVYPAKSWSPFDQIAVHLLKDIFNESFPRTLETGLYKTILGWQRITQAQNTQDFIGVNYYTRDRIQLRLSKNEFIHRDFPPNSQVSQSGFIANEPEGMYEAIHWARKFDKPIIITENGIDDPDDSLRPAYMLEHLHQVWRAVNFNIPVKGYFHWTLTDNFEWERGWSQKFGLWELDPETQTRTKRLSADLYTEIIKNNGISSEMVARYAPELFNKLFPN